MPFNLPVSATEISKHEISFLFQWLQNEDDKTQNLKKKTHILGIKDKVSDSNNYS